MPYVVTPEIKEALLEMPETGMGYQQVSAPSITKQNSDQYFVILNAYIALELPNLWSPRVDHQELIDLNIVMTMGIPMLPFTVRSGVDKPLSTPIEEFPYDIRDIRLIQGNSYRATTEENEHFIRFSAFKEDLRFTDKGTKIRPGTYFTTGLDVRLVRSGLMAVARYALPNPSPAIYRTDFRFINTQDIVCGTVEPKFDQSGGGTEIRVDSPDLIAIQSDTSMIPER